MRKKVTLVVMVATILGASLNQIVAKDNVVVLRSGRKSNIVGDIEKMSKKGLAIAVGRNSQKIAVHQIFRISYSNEPSELRSARNAILGGQLEQGIESLKQIDTSKVSANVRQDVDYFVIFAKAKLALRGERDLIGTAREATAFLKTHPQSIHYYEAVELIGDIAMALGKYPTAVKTYSQITKSSFKEFELKGALLEARALQLDSKYEEAQSKYDVVLDSGLNDTHSLHEKKLATIGKAACLVETGSVEPAIETLQKMIADNDPKDSKLFAQAYNALGSAYQKSGKTVDAVLAYLHVDVLFYNERDAHAESLFHLSKLWNQLNKPDRAVKARQTLSERYNGTVWAKRS